jgi:hypothetical protein
MDNFSVNTSGGGESSNRGVEGFLVRSAKSCVVLCKKSLNAIGSFLRCPPFFNHGKKSGISADRVVDNENSSTPHSSQMSANQPEIKINSSGKSSELLNAKLEALAAEENSSTFHPSQMSTNQPEIKINSSGKSSELLNAELRALTAEEGALGMETVVRNIEENALKFKEDPNYAKELWMYAAELWGKVKTSWENTQKMWDAVEDLQKFQNASFSDAADTRIGNSQTKPTTNVNSSVQKATEQPSEATDRAAKAAKRAQEAAKRAHAADNQARAAERRENLPAWNY